MKDIQGKERNLQDLLANKKYTIPFYQREYQWERKQVEELINDLMDEFNDSFKSSRRPSFGRQYFFSLLA